MAVKVTWVPAEKLVPGRIGGNTAAARPGFAYRQGIVGDGGKCRADGVVGTYGREGIGSNRPLGNPVHQDTGNRVAGIGSDGKGLIGPGLDTDRPRGRNGPTRSGRGGDGVGSLAGFSYGEYIPGDGQTRYPGGPGVGRDRVTHRPISRTGPGIDRNPGRGSRCPPIAAGLGCDQLHSLIRRRWKRRHLKGIWNKCRREPYKPLHWSKPLSNPCVL